MDLELAKKLNHSRLWPPAENRPIEEAVLKELGNPAPEELLSEAMAGLESEDRNYRFQMVRILGADRSDKAAGGILKALSDPARRVRRAAIQNAGQFAGYPGIAERLQEILDDESETTKIRGSAFHALSTGVFRASLAKSVDAAREFLEEAGDKESHRKMALQFLVMQDPLTGRAEEVLRHLVENGTREEAVAATRALCGFKVVNLGAVTDPAERRKVSITAEKAWGRAWVWVPRGSTARSGIQ